MPRSQIIRTCVLAILSLAAMPPQASTRVKPPKVVKVTELPYDLSEKALDRLPKPKAPKDFDAAIAAIQTGTLDDRLNALKRKAKRDLVSFPAGSFVMGDFGRLWTPSKLYFYDFKDDKPTHTVQLSAFSMAKFKVTFAEYDLFAEITGRSLPATSEDEAAVFRHPSAAVIATWADAQAYCAWVGQLLGKTMTLPTEAEWEYAARSGGQFFAFATDNGHVEYTRNMPWPLYTSQLWPAGREGFLGFSAGYYPPNPAGIHQMYLNGTEWTQDWYDADYYAKSPQSDPKGPETGTFKSVRGQYGPGSADVGFTFARGFAPPDKQTDEKTKQQGTPAQPYEYSQRYTHAIRCVSRP